MIDRFILIVLFNELQLISMPLAIWFQGRLPVSPDNIVIFMLLAAGLCILVYMSYRTMTHTHSSPQKDYSNNRKGASTALAPIEADSTQADRIIHELKQPISVMTMLADFTHDTIKQPATPTRDDMIRQNINEIAKQGKQCSRIIERMKQPGKKDQSKFKPIKINHIIRQALKEAINNNSEADIKVRQRLEENLPVIYADKAGIHQLFTNIANNAIDVMQQSKDRYLTIRSYRRSRGITIKISDTGCGIGQEHLNEIFDAYYTTKSNNGSGLGLSVCQNIVDNHDGTISANRNKSGGTSFQIFLPYK